MRDRLIELMQDRGNANTDSFPFESVADYLLENGVIVPPCETMFFAVDGKIYPQPTEDLPLWIIRNPEKHWYYTSREAAENALKERERG